MTERIRFRLGNRISYVIVAPAGTLAKIQNPDTFKVAENWKSLAMAAFDASKELYEEFNGAGATVKSSSTKLDERGFMRVRSIVKQGLEEGFLPVQA